MEKDKLVLLVTTAQQGDQEALNSLFNEFYNDLYYFALKTLKNDDIALDVTQEAFVEIINTIGNLKEPAAFVTWAKQITYHQCTRYFKKKKDVIVDEDEEGNTVFDTLKEENSEFIPDEALDKTDFKKTVMEIIDELSEEQRSAVMMHYFDEMSVQQIAEIQGVSEGTVKSRLNYARKAIKAAVEDYESKNGIKLHAIPFLPLIKWILEGSFEAKISVSSAKIVADGVTAATGTTVTATTAVSATTAATATTAVGIGAKIAALPIVTKVVAGVVAAAIAIGGGTTAYILSNKDPKDDKTTVSSVDSEQSSKEEKELVLEGVIPDGCTYTLYNGTVLEAGEKFPEVCTAGDTVSYGDYFYGYECVYAKNSDGIDEWYLWENHFDSGDSGLIESDAFGGWSVIVKDQTKTSYGQIVSKINGKPIKTLYATFFGCKNMTEAPKIPSTIKAMTAAYYDCASLKKAPVIPQNVERIMISFFNCVSLTGNVEINAKPDKSLKWYYSDTFSGTKNAINLVGKTPEEDLILIAQNSDNPNITVNGKKLENNIANTPLVITETSFYSGLTSLQKYKGAIYPEGSLVKYRISVTFFPSGGKLALKDFSETTVNDPFVQYDFLYPVLFIPQNHNGVYEREQNMEMGWIKAGNTFLPADTTWDELFTNEEYFQKYGGIVHEGVKYIPYYDGMGSAPSYYNYENSENGKISVTPDSNYLVDHNDYILTDMHFKYNLNGLFATITIPSIGVTEEIVLNLGKINFS